MRRVRSTVVMVVALAAGAGWLSSAADAAPRAVRVDEPSHLAPGPATAHAHSARTNSVAKPGKKNAKPTAKVTRTASTGGAPVTITFGSAGSKDRDGTIASYVWDFGDGTPTATGETVSHTYATAGNFTAKLTVTDNANASATATVKVSVPGAVLIDAVTFSQTTVSGLPRASALVKVVDSSGAPVKGAKITGAWSGKRKGPANGTTGADGTVALLAPSAGKGDFTLTISKVTKAGAVNAAASNKSTGGTFTVT